MPENQGSALTRFRYTKTRVLLSTALMAVACRTRRSSQSMGLVLAQSCFSFDQSKLTMPHFAISVAFSGPLSLQAWSMVDFAMLYVGSHFGKTGAAPEVVRSNHRYVKNNIASYISRSLALRLRVRACMMRDVNATRLRCVSALAGSVR